MTMSPERRARLVALGDLHRSWVPTALPEAAFDPADRPARSDYNLHYADVGATGTAEDAFHAAAREIMGLDPATGRQPAPE